MFFSERFNVDENLIDKYGAVDINLQNDTPLFIDPMLIFNSEKKLYKKLHNYIIEYLSFLKSISNDKLTELDIMEWFDFKEIPNNWLGLCQVGNRGRGSGPSYARYLYNTLHFVLDNHNISKSCHVEKIMLFKDNIGKDNISDLMVNLLLGFFCHYTENFALKYIDKSLLQKFSIEKIYFDFDKKRFINGQFTLPYVEINHKREFVLLTPKDILRQGDPCINYNDFVNHYYEIYQSISNATLKNRLNIYMTQALNEYEKTYNKKISDISTKKINSIKKNAFVEFATINKEIYDYYISIKENDKENKIVSQKERDVILYCEKELKNNIANLFIDYVSKNVSSAREEAINRIKYFKTMVEDCGGNAIFYTPSGYPVKLEKYFQKAFRFVWAGSEYQLDAETDNGGGQVDYIVSKGANDKVIIEFKLAKNNRLSHVFKQVERYEAANLCDSSIVVIIAFDENDINRVTAILERLGKKENIGRDIFIIDCRKDQVSASKL